jgi:isoleucyl-tRNA synthetase
MDQDGIKHLETKGNYTIKMNDESFDITLNDVEITTDDIPGWSVAIDGQITVALDITVTDELREEGLAREFVNRIQNLRKDLEFEVTDRITLEVEHNKETDSALTNFSDYICSETLAELTLRDKLENSDVRIVELIEGISVNLFITKQK